MASSRRKLATAIVPVLALLGTLLVSGSARAQLAEGDERISSDPKVIGRQIRAALVLSDPLGEASLRKALFSLALAPSFRTRRVE